MPPLHLIPLFNEGDFPDDLAVKNLPANTEGVGSISGSGRCPGEINGNPLQYSCLKNPIDALGVQSLSHWTTREVLWPWF